MQYRSTRVLVATKVGPNHYQGFIQEMSL